ncbi:pre-mRNA-splicing factor SPF27 [Geosmithia morbida]|uniref:Pre-mRNA-splicing factor SPF27 n=1 Tax=Geosmithia morbida TaxID=1094350 RepID=A0A9P5D423_9HYPO|nr:pre-mRNA-splicing factor SPF27 [Geosmithia morbida]KAF4121069.1 pre-mRNA-splicing factor SPF27 [Geosmithia morbida]
MAIPPAYHESLPYIDTEPTPSELDAARALVSAEQQRRDPPPSPPQHPSPSFSDIMAIELARAASGTALQSLSLSRYEAQEAPPPREPASTHLRVLEAAYVGESYLSSRLQTLELLDRHGRNAWLLGNHHLEAELRRVEADLAATRADIDRVNIERRRRQEDVRTEMHVLEDTWKRGVGRVLETEIAVEALRAQIRDELAAGALRQHQLQHAPE